MSRIKVISFDAEGTLVTSDFSQAMWHEAIPALYARKYGLDFTQAKTTIAGKYDEVGDHRLEWYDVRYWFNLLGLGAPEPVIQSCLGRASYYPEVNEVLSSLGGRYELVVASGTPTELLDYLIREIKPYFARIFSSVSHYQKTKNSEFYLAICQEMKVEPHEVIHVGDSWQFDFLNAKQAGINAFHLDRCGNNHDSLADLTQLKPDLLA